MAFATAGRLALGSALLAIGCGPPPPPSRPARGAVDDDPVALLASGAEAVLDLDCAQLRAWPTTARLLAGAPGPERQRLSRLGFEPLLDADLIAVAMTLVGTEAAEATVITQGRCEPIRLREALAAAEGQAPREVDYHDRQLTEGRREAFSMLTPRTAVFGSRAEVRRVIDVALGNEEGLRRAVEDRPLSLALSRAPQAKQGRPALLAALRLTAALRDRLRGEGFPAELLEWISLALAVGDGIDLGLVLGARDAKRAGELLASTRLFLDDLKQRPAIRLAGLAPFVDVQLAVRRDEVHLAWRLEQTRFDRLVARVLALLELITRRPETKP